MPDLPDAWFEYGLDAPGLVRGFLIGAGAAMLVGVAATTTSLGAARDIVLVVAALVTLYLAGMATLMIVWSKWIKVREREAMLDLIGWTGDEAVLDVGCGRGLMLVGAARRLTSGRAIGIDIWQASDQANNSEAAAIHNARVEGVDDRVSVQTADMRALPFADRSFDVVVSHWAVHNVEPAGERDRALTEIARVTRPGGTVMIADIANREAYAAALATLGFGQLRTIVAPLRDAVLAAISFGSFRPAVVMGTKSG